MPKKRHQARYSKPPSVAPASLSLSSSSRQASEHNGQSQSVNELLANLRRTTLSPEAGANVASTSRISDIAAPSVPPNLRAILQLPETPAPAPRRPQRQDGRGRRPPPGPPPPRSWISLTRPRRTSSHGRGQHGRPRRWPLPGVNNPHEGSLVDIALRHMAVDWEQQRDWNRFYLYTLPSRLRSALLRHVAELHSSGVSVADLRLVLSGPSEDELAEYGLPPPDMNDLNSDFFHLDLTGSVGKSVSLKEIRELLFESKRSTTLNDADLVQDSWDAPLPEIAPPIELARNLTHLSLAVDPGSVSLVSWKQLLSLAAKLPQLVELSLAGWPEPLLTPNARLASVTSPATGGRIQYSGTGIYSHELDGDWSEAILILRRLSRSLYGLEYLDLTGCGSWAPALREQSDGELKVDFVDWVSDWGKITTLRLNSGYALAEDSDIFETLRFAGWIDTAAAIEKHIRAQRAGRGRHITVERDTLSEKEKERTAGHGLSNITLGTW
ncbi:hypothetical protein GGS20DRAFT_566686 [Poronia punctata]|nr:hypothetical protein GGS20DRAFT_566686 [Poronia punctata]